MGVKKSGVPQPRRCCGQPITVVTPRVAICDKCGQRFRLGRFYGREGWKEWE